MAVISTFDKSYMKTVDLLLIFLLNKGICEKVGEENDITNCRERIRLIGLDKDDQFEFVTVKLHSKLVLWCHYCKEGVSFAPKIWYKQNRLKDELPKEVQLGMESKLADNRVYSTPDHTLIVNKVVEDDSALYYCQGPKHEQEDYRYNYLVDVVPEKVPLRLGNVDDWKKHSQTSLKKINEDFLNSTIDEYVEIRQIGVQIHTVFEPTRWGPCNGCTKIRRRFSECRMKTKPIAKTDEIVGNLTNSSNVMNHTNEMIRSEQILLNAFELSCHSLIFAKHYPKISQELMKVENFVFTESCYAPCQIYGPSTAPKYRNTIVLYEGDHLTLICPEATSEKEVVWMKDGVSLQANTVEGNIRVDSLYNLYISHATSDEAANYTCFVDSQKIQEVIVLVHVQSVISSKAFMRHIQYLGFIFIFSVIFYTAGLIITWTRRDTFKKIDFNRLAKKPRWDDREDESEEIL